MYLDKTMSPTIKEISKALSVAQNKISTVIREKQGYGYKYAELSDCLDMIKLPLFESELSLTQLCSFDYDGKPVLVTMLMHSSGEWIRSIILLKAQASKQTNEMQALGSGITYLRRYSLCSLLGIGQEDDDGERAGPKSLESNSPSQKQSLVDQLTMLCEKNKIDVKEFASAFRIKSSDIGSLQNAVINFYDLVADFYDNHKVKETI